MTYREIYESFLYLNLISIDSEVFEYNVIANIIENRNIKIYMIASISKTFYSRSRR
ncbi:MAG: hypothetical protein ACRCYE_12545 [Sarcina sp.]